MNFASTLPDHLNKDARLAVSKLLADIEILPVSCLLYRADKIVCIHRNRRLPDDFIYIAHAGCLSARVDGVRREMKPGDFMMVPAGVQHDVKKADGIDTYQSYALHMHILDIRGQRLLGLMDSPFGRLVNRESWFEKLATCTHLMGQSDPAATPFFNQLVTWILYEQLMQGNQLRESIEPMDRRVTVLLGEIRSRCAADWRVSTMAEHCNLSVSRFRELFGHCTGTSPKKYVQNVRLTHARSLLATDSSLSVQDVADMVGIGDAHYFHNIYKARFGETPRGRGAMIQGRERP